jgi:5-methylcytosine-specific restriction endonuclease McrA
MVAQSILLLNASYEPLTVVTLARAVKLLLAGVRVRATPRRSATSTSRSPAPPRPWRCRKCCRSSPCGAKIYAHVLHRRTPAWTRRGVFERDDFTCAYCGRRYAARDLTVDHLIPTSHGGAATWGNTVAAYARWFQRPLQTSARQIARRTRPA